MIHDRITPHDGSNEFCQDCERQIDRCICDDDVEQTEPDNTDWEAIAAQIDYWAALDQAYWTSRREREYEAFLERKTKCLSRAK